MLGPRRRAARVKNKNGRQQNEAARPNAPSWRRGAPRCGLACATGRVGRPRPGRPTGSLAVRVCCACRRIVLQMRRRSHLGASGGARSAEGVSRCTWSRRATAARLSSERFSTWFLIRPRASADFCPRRGSCCCSWPAWQCRCRASSRPSSTRRARLRSTQQPTRWSVCTRFVATPMHRAHPICA